MKKIALVLTIFLSISLTSDAFVDTQYMTTPQYMQNTGYSAEMSEMMSVVNQDPYREPYVEPSTPSGIAKRIYNYIVPGVYTDLDFYNHEINFDGPSWKDL
ncbi:MAG: hypothetical protein LUH05_03510 [Candidatus Gastranaerophilales bacterium]|nr:hypothetical protein [Candidatus Gastranaerophilales bacterium]